MKRFLLYLSALFLSVSFANAQTYEINSGTGVLNNGTSKSSVWTANDCPAGLKITATDSNGNAVNAISYWSPTYKFYAAGLFDGTSNSSSSPTTYTISVNDGYLITGYKLEYKASSRNAVTLSNEYEYTNAPANTSMYDMTENDLNTRTTTFTVLSSDAARASSNSVNVCSFTVTVQAVGEGGEEPGDDSSIMEQYDAIAKPTFGTAGNTTFVKAATLAGDVNAEVAGIQAVAGQACVTNAIEVAAGAKFDLNITYQLNWGDLAIYQIENGEATMKYGYYEGSWGTGDTGLVIENIKQTGVEVEGASTVIYPITISYNHNPGDIIVVRAITGDQGANNSAYEQGISEGGYVDFLFVVTEEVAPKSYALAVGETGWATLFLDFNAAIPTDVKAYTVTAVNDGYVTLTQVTGVLPANTGVIVNATKGDYAFAYSADEAADVAGNLLKGSVADENIEGEAYVLGVVDGEVGLYMALANGTSWLNNANKAYLPASAVSNKSAQFFGFDWDGTTGIEEVKTENGEVKAVYDLTGRRVEAITAPGIYIVNGKKVLVK